VTGGELRSGCLCQLIGGLYVDAANPSRLREGDVGGDQGDLRPTPGGGPSERHAHTAAGAVAYVADWVDWLSGASGGDEDPEAVPGTASRWERCFDLGQQVGGGG
jgi:hypothetical protein